MCTFGCEVLVSDDDGPFEECRCAAIYLDEVALGEEGVEHTLDIFDRQIKAAR
jgi:hypothetical protein